MGDAGLLAVARAVADAEAVDVRALIDDMTDTMRAAGGVGLAAPQIGVGLRVVVFGFEASERYPGEAPVPLIALVNPWIEPIGDATEDGWEGCLSIPGLRGLMPRAARIRYGGALAGGGLLEREASGFHARVVQHEVDHLDGVLYPSRMTDMARFGFVDVLFPDRAAAEAACG